MLIAFTWLRAGSVSGAVQRFSMDVSVLMLTWHVLACFKP